MILGVFIYFGSPFIIGFFQKGEKVAVTNEQFIDALNITVVNPTPGENEREFEITTIKEPVIIITPTPKMNSEEYHYYTLGYSYYYPDLGGVNCHEDNWDEENKICADTTASGKSWRSNMYRGVALHYDLLIDLPFGTLFEVIKPDEVKGFYEVIDICPGCTPRFEGQPYFIDFLDDKQRLAWGEEVIVKVKILQ